ncbi:MAG: AAA family ATPase [Actinomycetota bacterium]
MAAPLIIVTGPPGTGKTTVADELAARHDPSAVVTGDHFLEYLRSGKIEPWLAAAHAQNTAAMRITARTARDYALAGWTTILEGIIGPWFLPVVLEELGADLEVHYVVLDAPLDICQARVTARGRGSMTEAVTTMHAEFANHRMDGHTIGADRPTEEVADAISDAIHRGDLRVTVA